MSSIIGRSDVFTMSEAMEKLPGHPSRTTLWRWSRKGYALPDGSRVFLKTRNMGRRIVIAREDMDSFVDQVSKAYGPEGGE